MLLLLSLMLLLLSLSSSRGVLTIVFYLQKRKIEKRRLWRDDKHIIRNNCCSGHGVTSMVMVVTMFSNGEDSVIVVDGG